MGANEETDGENRIAGATMQLSRAAAIALLAAATCWWAGPAPAADHYVAPDGRPDAAGSRGDPWDLASALAGRQDVRPGETVWVRGGTYRSERAYSGEGPGFQVRLAGQEGQPVRVRACPGERVTIDGGLQVVRPADHLWLRDLEITVLKQAPRSTDTPGSHPGDLQAPSGGLKIYAGTGCRYINLFIHDNYGSGVDFWSSATDSELYGCIIVNNGWKAPDRNHGHCIYTQNRDGTKVISNCILKTRWGGGQYTMHAYGSERAWVDHYVIEQNVAYDAGPFLVGGGRPSRDIEVRGNFLYRVPMLIGYDAPHNRDCRLRGNVLFGSDLVVKRYRRVRLEDNLVVRGGVACRDCENVRRAGNRTLNRPPEVGPGAVLLPNRYDRRRAHVIVFNWRGAHAAQLNVGGFMAPGDRFRLFDPEDLYGEPLHDGVCRGDTVSVPAPGEFCVYVMRVTRR